MKSFDSCSKSHSNGFYLPLQVWLLQERHPAGLWLKHSCDLRRGREGLKSTDGCGGIDGGQKKSVELQDFSGNLKNGNPHSTTESALLNGQCFNFPKYPDPSKLAILRTLLLPRVQTLPLEGPMIRGVVTEVV